MILLSRAKNQQYQEWLDALREELSLADRDNTALEKENEQLKSSDNLADCECEIAKLRKENEQLKNENAKMKKELSSLAEFNQKAIL